MRERMRTTEAVVSENEGDVHGCQGTHEEGAEKSLDGESLRRRNQRQISRILRELLRKYGPDLSALSLEEINEMAATLIWEKSDRLPDSKGGRE